MDIFTDGGEPGVIDITKAKRELAGALAVTHEPTRARMIHELHTAIMLDIAASLRPIAAEAVAAMPSPFTELDTEPDPSDAEGERDFFIKGDLVIADGMDEPGEIKSFGESEGSIYANVLLANGVEIRPWLDSLHRLVGDERDDDTMQEASEADVTPEPDEPHESDGEKSPGEDVARELAADIDEDFDGDHHPAAESALDVLKANEAQRKAAKKKGSGK